MSASTEKLKTPRRRRSAETARSEVMVEARRMLLEEGPQAVTLKGVAERLGMTHVNVLHHFGSAQGLQEALMRSMADDLRERLNNRDYKIQPGDGSARKFVDLVFDAFNEGGAGKLTAWMALSQGSQPGDPLIQMAAEIAEDMADETLPRTATSDSFLMITLLALGDSLGGGVLRKALNLPPDSTRDLAARLMLSVLGRDQGA